MYHYNQAIINTSMHHACGLVRIIKKSSRSPQGNLGREQNCPFERGFTHSHTKYTLKSECHILNQLFIWSQFFNYGPFFCEYRAFYIAIMK